MNKAYNVDCLTAMHEIPNNTIDLTVTSPPYDNLRTYNGFTFDWKRTLEELHRITKEGGVVVWIVADQTKDGSETGTSFKQALWAKECGFNLHDTMIWNKSACAFPDYNRYQNVFEYMFIFSKGKPKTYNLICDKRNKHFGCRVSGTERQENGETKPVSEKQKSKIVREYGPRWNIWDIVPEKHNTSGHPAVYPITLARDHIKTWSNEGDTVLDPFLGSGTTRLAAYDLNRNFVGFEIDKTYFDRQEERFAAYTSQMSLYQTEQYRMAI